MSTLLLLLLIIFPIFCLVFISNVLFSFLKKVKIKSSAGFFLLDIDLKNNRLRKTNLLNKEEKSQEVEYLSEGWMDINIFLSSISKTNEEKFLIAINAITKNSDYVKFIIKNDSLIEPAYSVQWLVELFKTNDLVSATVRWDYIKNIPKNLTIISKEELFKNQNKYKSFIAFNLKTNDQNEFQVFMTILCAILKLKNLEFLISKSIVTLIIYGENNEEIEKKINYVLSKIKKGKTEKELLLYYDGLGIVESDGVTNINDLAKIMNRIYFSLIKSKQLKKPFLFNIKNIFFNEFEEFKENYAILNNIIKSKNIPTIKTPIIEFKSKNIIANYIKPIPKYLDNFWTNMIIQNKNILPNLDDFYFEKIINSLDQYDQYFIDINDYMIIQNIEKIKHHISLIFIIQFNELANINNLELIVSNLKANNIKFGIKISNIASEVITLIEFIKPHIIIIREELINTSDLTKFLNLKQLITLSKKNPVTLIFENPAKSEFSKNTINYYYNK